MIIRVKKRGLPFVQVEKGSVKDPRLSLKATGLLTLLLSFPDDWRIDHRALARMKPDGEHTFRQALKELETCGYLTRKRVSDSRGQWSWEQHLYEVSESTPPTRVSKTATRDAPSDDSPSRGFPSRGNRDSKREVRRSSNSPSRENQHSEGPRHDLVSRCPGCADCKGGYIYFDDGSFKAVCPGQRVDR
jgi:hypothetical protein